MNVDILPLPRQGDSYRIQRGIIAILNHLGGFLLLTPYFRVHFTGEPGMSCPWGLHCIAILFFVLYPLSP